MVSLRDGIAIDAGLRVKQRRLVDHPWWRKLEIDTAARRKPPAGYLCQSWLLVHSAPVTVGMPQRQQRTRAIRVASS